MVQNLQMSTSV